MPTGHVLLPGAPKWKVNPVTWSIATQNFGNEAHYNLPMPFAAFWPAERYELARSVITRGLTTWSSQCGLNFIEVSDSADVHIRFGFANLSVGAQTTRRVILTDMVQCLIQSSLSWVPFFDNESIMTDMAKQTAHELGHAIGFDHATSDPSIMSTFSSGLELYPIDIEGAVALYGPPGVIVPPPPPEPPNTVTHIDLYKGNKAQVPNGIYFNKPDGSLAQTVVQQVLIPDLKIGDKLIINAQTTVSCLRNDKLSYPGFGWPVFTAAAIFLSSRPQETWLDSFAMQIGPQSGQDIHDGSKNAPMNPYYNHDQTLLHSIQSNGDQWVVFAAWCSSGYATGDSVAKNEYLLLFAQQTELAVMRFSNDPTPA